ncbi:MAG: thiolase family protein [Chloroflexi bacterium]|nr:thiolase family protein [Chloroflexota bacterium]
MPNAVIIAAIRTPIGKHGGVLKDVRPDDLAAHVICELVKRTGIDPHLIEEVYFGCANQAGEDNRNVARMATLLSGLPEQTAAQTVNRLCASGLAAVNNAARAIRVGEGDVLIAGGVESMSRAPWSMPKSEGAFPTGNVTLWDTTLGWRYPNPKMQAMFPLEAMGETAENIYEMEKTITRDQQDAFALASHQRAVAATESGRFAGEIVAVPVPQRKGDPLIVDRDEQPRKDTSLDKLAALKPAFRKGGTVTAGNASSLNDGAAAILLVSEAKAGELGLKPIARIVSGAAAGVNPRTMGLGPVPATRKALQRAGLTGADIGLVELNEAFAVQALAVMSELGFRHEITNVNGGAIALGHPLGCSGARILTTLVHEMRRRGVRYGLATLCVGVGQGETTIVELL